MRWQCPFHLERTRIFSPNKTARPARAEGKRKEEGREKRKRTVPLYQRQDLRNTETLSLSAQ